MNFSSLIPIGRDWKADRSEADFFNTVQREIDRCYLSFGAPDLTRGIHVTDKEIEVTADEKTSRSGNDG